MTATATRPALRLRRGVAGFYSFCKMVGLELQSYQRPIAVAVIAGQEKEVLCLLARGGGKTTLMAAVAVHHLLTHPRPQVIVGAASVDQASVLFRAAVELAEHPLIAEKLEVRHLVIRRADGAGFLKIVPSNGARTHGLSPSLAICDELHAHRDDELYLALRTAMGKRADARMVTTSTASELGDTPLVRLRSRALQAPHVERTGALLEAHGRGLRLIEYSVPEDADWRDRAWWRAANPQPWTSDEALADLHEGLPESAFRRYVLNQFVSSERAWIPAGTWQLVVGTPKIATGSRIWAGVDAGGSTSDSALAYVDEQGQVGVQIFSGQDGPRDVADALRQLAQEHQLVACGFDPWGMAPLAIDLEREGMQMIAVPQSDARMTGASDRLRRAVTERTITVADDPRLASHAAQAIARTCGSRGWRLSKLRKTDCIDGLIAIALALEMRALEEAPRPVRFLGWL